jgi:hypothetical protein
MHMRFMVPFHSIGTPEQLMPLVPAEMARVAELRSEGIIESLELASAGGRGWLLMAAPNEAGIRRALDSLPMAPLLQFEVVVLREM